MGFETPQPPLSEYLKQTTSGDLQLPDFQRGWTWEDERVRSLLVTVLRGHPMGAVMLLETGNDLVRFKPKPIEGTKIPAGIEPKLLLLDGQQRLTSLTQALTGTGVVNTKDGKGKLLRRRYYVDMRKAIEGDDAIDDAVFGVPEDGVIRENFGRDIKLDLSTRQLELAQEMFPLRLLLAGFDGFSWLMSLDDRDLSKTFSEAIYGPVTTYQIPAIQLNKQTSKSAVATVFEKVNTGGVPLSVFELLTAMFAGDAAYFAAHATDFRLNDDWRSVQERFAHSSILSSVSSTDFLQGITLLATLERQRRSTADRAPAVSAKRDDILKLQLEEYVRWREDLVNAFEWCATFVADQHIFATEFLPYSTQLVPLAVIRVILGEEADAHGVKARLRQWYWCGILGELYGSSTETRFARDVEQVPAWARDGSAPSPLTVNDAIFVESRLYTLRTRRSAAYKGIYALIVGCGAKDWVKDVSFDKVQYVALATDIHHIFPQKWCKERGLDVVKWDSIVNKTPLAAETNRAIGGAAPSAYLQRVASRARLSAGEVDALLASHGVSAGAARSDDFDAHFGARKAWILDLIEGAMGKRVQREESDLDTAQLAAEYEPEDEVEIAIESSAKDVEDDDAA